MKQKVIEFNNLRVLMWEDQSLIIEHQDDDRSWETNIVELLYIVQEYQKEFDVIRVTPSGTWRGIEGSP